MQSQEVPPRPDRESRGQSRVDDAPFVDVGGRTDRGAANGAARDFFLTVDLDRSMVLGPSSLPVDIDVPWSRASGAKLMVVAEGVAPSGHDTGAEVAQAVARYVLDRLPWIPRGDADDADDETAQALRRGFRLCHRRLLDLASERDVDDSQPVAASLTMLLMTWPGAHVAHVGGGRAYLYRDKQLLQLTRDQTRGQDLVDRAGMSATEAAESPIADVLSSTLGDPSGDLDIDCRSYRLEPGDQLLLCTGSLHGAVSNLEIQRELATGVTAAMCVRRLVEAARRQGEAGDVTAVVARANRRV